MLTTYSFNTLKIKTQNTIYEENAAYFGLIGDLWNVLCPDACEYPGEYQKVQVHLPGEYLQGDERYVPEAGRSVEISFPGTGKQPVPGYALGLGLVAE